MEHDFLFWKLVPNWVYFGQGEDFKLTTELFEKSAIFPQPWSNQKQLKRSNKWINYVNKWSFAFKIKLCLFQVTKTLIILYEGDSNFSRATSKNTPFQEPADHFLLHFFNVYVMNVNYAKFQKKF